MFQLDKAEEEALRSQIVISNEGRGGRRYAPYVFTEQGVAMLSGVLRSDRAVAVNIAIMRALRLLSCDGRWQAIRHWRNGSISWNETRVPDWGSMTSS